jgi:hypothetical protein
MPGRVRRGRGRDPRRRGDDEDGQDTQQAARREENEAESREEEGLSAEMACSGSPSDDGTWIHMQHGSSIPTNSIQTHTFTYPYHSNPHRPNHNPTLSTTTCNSVNLSLVSPPTPSNTSRGNVQDRETKDLGPPRAREHPQHRTCRQVDTRHRLHMLVAFSAHKRPNTRHGHNAREHHDQPERQHEHRALVVPNRPVLLVGGREAAQNEFEEVDRVVAEPAGERVRLDARHEGGEIGGGVVCDWQLVVCVQSVCGGMPRWISDLGV